MKRIITQFCFISLLFINVSCTNDENLPVGLITLDGRPAPELKLNDFDGEPFDLENSKGHWVFVHFWATWCGPCRKEMPTIQTMAYIMEKTSLEIMMINTSEDEESVFNFMGIVAPDMTPLMDLDGKVTERWQPRGLPSTFLVDPEGKLRYLALGGRQWDSPPFIRFLRRLINSTK